MDTNFNIGTFNVRTLQSEIRKEQLSKDLDSYNLDLLCVQETKIQDGVDRNINNHRLICFSSDSRFYGSGFFIHKKWTNNLFRTWKVSDRICVLQLIIDKNKPPTGQGITNTISIINVYAPTSQLSEKHPDIKEQFYSQLEQTITNLGSKTIIFVAGDFNAKIGKRNDEDTCVGKFSKGKRNNNGETLIELCEEKKLFVTNSAFNHPSRHQTTWIGQFKDKTTGLIKNIYNQIDFILCPKRHKHLLVNSRSYAGTLLSSDHKLVKTSLVDLLVRRKIWKKELRNEKVKTINVAPIVTNEQRREKYQHTLDEKLTRVINVGVETTSTTERLADKLKEIQVVIKQAGEESVGFLTNTRQRKNNDPELSVLSKQQKELRLKIQNTKDPPKKAKLKSERNKILHNIRKRKIEQKNIEIDKQIEYIDTAQCDRAMFKATKLLNQKPFENPKVEDENGKLATSANDILDIVSNHFKNKFTDNSEPEIIPFQGESKPLQVPITADEVRKAFNSLSNNRSPGEDQINAELLKYSTPLLDQIIADIFNEAFEKHENININAGVLIALQKPGKKKGPPNNLRPITLLNTLRKTLSIITLNRIRPEVENYLSKNQSGFRPNRSTADVVWSHKWLSAKAVKEDVNIKISGIDMSAAFDTINRQKLLDILNTIIEEDEHRIIQFLLSNTEIKTRINGSSKTNPFISNVGTPQGDSLSPVLFIIYLEHALKEVRETFPEPKTKFEEHIPNEIAYADDVDFISHEYADVRKIEDTLKKYQLKVNTDKTEYTSVSRNEEEWKAVKKVGSLIGDVEDVQRRKQLSSLALNKLHQLWIKGNKLKALKKIHLYKTLVKPILMYNCGTWALTQTEEEKLNAFHRKQLKRVLNIKYPTRITNKSLYKKCQEKPLSLQILSSRWSLFGHILRRDKDIPANKATRSYFIESGKKYKGRPKTTLPIVLNKDLALINHPIRLHSLEELEIITKLAQDRQKWRELTIRIERAAEASQTENWDAIRQ